MKEIFRKVLGTTLMKLYFHKLGCKINMNRPSTKILNKPIIFFTYLLRPTNSGVLGIHQSLRMTLKVNKLLSQRYMTVGKVSEK